MHLLGGRGRGEGQSHLNLILLVPFNPGSHPSLNGSYLFDQFYISKYHKIMKFLSISPGSHHLEKLTSWPLISFLPSLVLSGPHLPVPFHYSRVNLQNTGLMSNINLVVQEISPLKIMNIHNNNYYYY